MLGHFAPAGKHFFNFFVYCSPSRHFWICKLIVGLAQILATSRQQDCGPAPQLYIWRMNPRKVLSPACESYIWWGMGSFLLRASGMPHSTHCGIWAISFTYLSHHSKVDHQKLFHFSIWKKKILKAETWALISAPPSWQEMPGKLPAIHRKWKGWSDWLQSSSCDI